MGYDTNFEGTFDLDHPLSAEHLAYLKKFNNTRRVRRNPAICQTLADPLRTAVGLPVGEQGCFFVGKDKAEKSIINDNKPPIGQPGLYCQWTPSDCGTVITWDQGEKFYNHREWLVYYLQNFIVPWGYVLNGTIEYQGEECGDHGEYIIIDNMLTVT